MHPNVLKVLATCILAVATSLETQAVLPPGVAAAIGMLLNFVVGMFHPQAGAKPADPAK